MRTEETQRDGNTILLSNNLEGKQKIDSRKCTEKDELRLECNSDYRNFLKVYFLNQEFYVKSDFSEDATLGFNKNLTIIMWSKAAEKLLGYTEEEILGRKIDLIVPNYKVDEVMKLIAKLENGETIHSYESLRKHQDGRLIPVGISNTPIYNHRGEFEGVFVQYRDLSEKMRCREQIESTEKLWRNAIKGGKFGVWEWSIDTDVIQFHNNWYHLIGIYDIDDKMMAEDWLKHVYDEDIPEMMDMLTIAQFGMGYVCEYRMLTQDGQLVWIRGKGEVTEWDEWGRPVKMVGTNEDITDRKLIEEQLAEKCRLLELSRKEADRANQAKTKFLAGISHEIRTPMNGILGLIHLLRKTKLDHKQHKWLNMLQESVDCQMSIINNMLDITKIEDGKIETEKNLFNVKTLVTEVFEQLRILCRPKRLEAKLSFDRDIKHMVFGDKLRIKQVLYNLINNAVKFTDHGSISIEVRLQTSDELKECIEFKIIDTGIGISPEDQERIFDSYYQGDVSSKKKHMGTGLGLAISKYFARLMDGDIEVDSMPGKGSSFRFYCNLTKYKKNTNRLEGDELVDDSYKTIPPINSSLEWSEFSDMIILSVEDNEINQEIVEAVVKNCGFSLLTASSGEEALLIMEKYHVDIILMDIQMPGMDGYELTKRIRENDNFKRIPIIAMTAYAMETDRIRCLKAGMSDFIAKPIEIKQFVKCICKYIDKSA